MRNKVKVEEPLQEISSYDAGKRRGRATIGMLLFIADLAAALWMAYNLHKLCHKNYAFAVFALGAMPGVICGCIFFFTEAMLCAPFVPCLMIPTEIVFHVWNIKSVTKDSFNRTKVVSALETGFQAVPGLIMSIIIMLNLQITDTFVIYPAVVFLVSILFNMTDWLSSSAHGLDHSLTKGLYCFLSLIIDVCFRIGSLAYLFATKQLPLRIFSFILPLLYFVPLAIYILTSFNVLNAEEEASILASFLMSGFWHKNTRFQIRPISKLSYNSLAFLFLGAATYFAKKSPPDDPRLDQNSRLYNDSKSDLYGCWNATEILISQKFDCIDLCSLTRTQGDFETCQWKFCTDLILDPELEMKILYGLWFLLFLSTLEVILEKYISCMPRRVFVDSIPKIRTDKKTVPMAQRMSNMLPF